MRRHRGFALLYFLVVLGILIILTGVYYLLRERTAYGPISDVEISSPERQIGGYEACVAGCRDQYGGSGSAGFDACVRECGAVGPAQPH